MKSKFKLITAFVVALTLSGGVYAYTNTTASITGAAVTASEADLVTCNKTATQPEWDSIVPEAPGGTETLRPNAAGDETNISSYSGDENHYLNVDEVTPDGYDTDVYTKGLPWERDLYHIADSIEGFGDIKSVTVYAHAIAKETPTQASLKIALKSGTTVSESNEIWITTSWGNYSYTWTTNPDTGDAFYWDEIDSLQVGVSIRRCDPGKETYVTQVYVEVEYGPVIKGDVPTGDLFIVYPNADYTDDLAVKVYLVNTGNLTKAYFYLNMELYLEGSVEAGETPNYRVLSLENGVACFHLEGGDGVGHTLSVTGGGYRLVSDDTSKWEEGWTVTPELYCEATQR